MNQSESTTNSLHEEEAFGLLSERYENKRVIISTNMEFTIDY